jgi:hypothetical protein
MPTTDPLQQLDLPSDEQSKTSKVRNRLLIAVWVLGFFFAEWVAMTGWFAILGNRDFAPFWVAGKLARTGDALAAYDMVSLKAAGSQWLGTTVKIVFPYPSHTLLLTVPLSLLPFKMSFWLWQAFSAALFYRAAKPHLPNGFPTILVILTPAALISIVFGQVGLFYGALWLFAFNGSWIAAALLTFKPHLGFLVAVEMIRRRLVMKTVLAAASLILLSVLIFGTDVWSASVFGAATKQLGMLSGGQMIKWYTQVTTPMLSYGVAGWALFAIAAIVLLSRNFHVFTAATATFLISPYGFHYDMTVVCVGFGVLLFEEADAMPPWHRLACAAAFLSPGLVAFGSWLIPPILLTGLYVQSLYQRGSKRLPDVELTPKTV